VVQNVVASWFKPEHINMKVLSRDAKIYMV
jgi:hypothetical protein